MKIIEYDRVSTKKQEDSGLGLAAQRKAVADYAKANNGTIIAKYREVESGRKSDRPELEKAIAHARLAKATLVVAKLDRLARNVQFMSTLMNSGIEFVCCDNPKANRLTIHILAAVAEEEAIAISRRTKDALAVARANGVLLGSNRPGHWQGRKRKRGFKQATAESSKLRSKRTKAAYSFLMPTIRTLYQEAQQTQKVLRARAKKLIAEVNADFAGQIKSAEAMVENATGEKNRRAAVEALEKLMEERQAAVAKARATGNHPPYGVVASKLNEMGHTTTSGMPFTDVAVFRVLKRYQEAVSA